MDVVKICEVVDGCEDCPKYGDDCDGDKMTEHTDYISRADAIGAVHEYYQKRFTENSKWDADAKMLVLEDKTIAKDNMEICNIIKALPSAELPKGYLISRADAIDAVRKCVVESELLADWNKAMESAQELLSELPSADAEWIDNGIPDSILSKCSNCGYTAGAFSFNFCPNCGAKMKGGAE